MLLYLWVQEKTTYFCRVYSYKNYIVYLSFPKPCGKSCHNYIFFIESFKKVQANEQSYNFDMIILFCILKFWQHCVLAALKHSKTEHTVRVACVHVPAWWVVHKYIFWIFTYYLQNRWYKKCNNFVFLRKINLQKKKNCIYHLTIEKNK